MYRVVIADDEPITRMDLAGMLKDLGMDVVGEAGDGFDAIEVCRSQKPDVVFLDVRMPVFDGFGAAETIVAEELAGCVILLTAYSDRESIERAKQVGVMGYLVKPVEQRLLLPTIEVAVSQGQRLRQSRLENQKTRRELEDSRLVQRAQTVLARQENIGESQAYKLMRQMAMDKRVPMTVIAEALLKQEADRDEVARTKKILMAQKSLTEEAAFKMIQELAKQLGCTREQAAALLRREIEKL